MKKAKKVIAVFIMVCAILMVVGQSSSVEASPKLATPKITVVKTSSNSVAVKWNKVRNAEKYFVYCSKNGGKYKKIATTTDKIYIHQELELGTNYSYKVKAVEGKKTSKYSKIKSIATGNEGYLLDLIQPYDTSINYKDYSNDLFKMAGDSYSHGFSCPGNNDTTYFNLHGDYSTLSFYFGTINAGNSSECKVNIYVDDRLVDSFVIGSHDLPIRKEVDVKNGQKLMINTKSDGGMGCGVFGFGEIKLKL